MRKQLHLTVSNCVYREKYDLCMGCTPLRQFLVRDGGMAETDDSLDSHAKLVGFSEERQLLGTVIHSARTLVTV